MITKEAAPRCKLCGDNEMILLGEMNGLKIYSCPKCDKKN